MAMEPVPMTVGRFWRFLTLGVGLGYTMKLALSGYHGLRNSWSSGGEFSESLTHHPQAEYARGVIKKEISKSQTDTTEYSATKDAPPKLRYPATKDVPPELRLARIHKFISEVINGDIDVKEIGCKPSYLNVDRPSSSSSEIDKFLERQRGELEQFIKSVKKLARIHKFIVKNGEAAKSKTLGELAEDLRAFGIGGIWSELAEAKGNEVVKKD